MKRRDPSIGERAASRGIPRLATVSRLIHTVTGRSVAADAGRAGAYVYHIPVGASDRDSAYQSSKVAVGDVLSILSVIRRLPHSTARRSLIVGVGSIAHRDTVQSFGIRAH